MSTIQFLLIDNIISRIKIYAISFYLIILILIKKSKSIAFSIEYKTSILISIN